MFGAAAVLLVGVVLRLVLGGSGVGDRSAIVMTVVLAAGAWLAARFLAGPRAAFGVALGLVALLDVAGLPRRGATEYDDLQAFYRTDQSFSASVPAPAGASVVTVLVEPVFEGPQARFGLAGEVNGVSVQWTCPFRAGQIQRIALPLPTAVTSGTMDVRLHLSGAPDRDSQYLVVYASSRLGGFVIGTSAADAVGPDVTRCALT
jgi:hypothetical protein